MDTDEESYYEEVVDVRAEINDHVNQMKDEMKTQLHDLFGKLCIELKGQQAKQASDQQAYYQAQQQQAFAQQQQEYQAKQCAAAFSQAEAEAAAALAGVGRRKSEAYPDGAPSSKVYKY